MNAEAPEPCDYDDDHLVSRWSGDLQRAQPQKSTRDTAGAAARLYEATPLLHRALLNKNHRAGCKVWENAETFRHTSPDDDQAVDAAELVQAPHGGCGCPTP